MMNHFLRVSLKSVLLILLVGMSLPFNASTTSLPAHVEGLEAVHVNQSRDESQQTRSGNPIIPGWYADPEAHVFHHEYWIYPTYSARYDSQVFFDAFSSKDLITWKRHPRIFSNVDAPWVKRALWAPSVVEKGGWYYLFFGANDIQNAPQFCGIGVARARHPAGPFKDYLGKPLIDKFHNGAQPIDQFIFKDADASYYIIYGGWRTRNNPKIKKDFSGLILFSHRP